MAAGTIRTFSITQMNHDDQTSGGSEASSAVSRTVSSKQASAPQGLLIRRTVVNRMDGRPSSQGNQTLQRSNTRPGQVLRRADGASSQGQTLQRTRGPPAQGQVLQRNGPPRSGGYGRSRGGGAAGQTGARQSQPGKPRRRKPGKRFGGGMRDESDAPTEEELNEYVAEHIDPPHNPSERFDYNPIVQSQLELEKDWPNTPLSASGLTATVIQKIEWLARRLPHGYQTPEQIAEHFHKGNLTRFESEEEKQQVLKLAQGLAKSRANMLTDRKGEQHTPADMSFAEINKNDEAKFLYDTVVKGTIPEAPKHNMPFLDSIVRNLRNNETFDQPHADQFLAKIQSMIPKQGARKASSTAGNARA